MGRQDTAVGRHLGAPAFLETLAHLVVFLVHGPPELLEGLGLRLGQALPFERVDDPLLMGSLASSFG